MPADIQSAQKEDPILKPLWDGSTSIGQGNTLLFLKGGLAVHIMPDRSRRTYVPNPLIRKLVSHAHLMQNHAKLKPSTIIHQEQAWGTTKASLLSFQMKRIAKNERRRKRRRRERQSKHMNPPPEGPAPPPRAQQEPPSEAPDPPSPPCPLTSQGSISVPNGRPGKYVHGSTGPATDQEEDRATKKGTEEGKVEPKEKKRKDRSYLRPDKLITPTKAEEKPSFHVTGITDLKESPPRMGNDAATPRTPLPTGTYAPAAGGGGAVTLNTQEIRIARQARQLLRQRISFADAHKLDRGERSMTARASRAESPQPYQTPGIRLPATGKRQPAVQDAKQPANNRVPYRGIQNPENKYCYVISALQVLASFPKLSSYLRNWLMARPPRITIDSRIKLVQSIITTIGALRPPPETEHPPLHPASISWITQAKMLQLLDPNLKPGKDGDAGLALRGILRLLRGTCTQLRPAAVSVERRLPDIVKTTACSSCSDAKQSVSWGLPITLFIDEDDPSPITITELLSRWRTPYHFSSTNSCKRCGSLTFSIQRLLGDHAECLILKSHSYDSGSYPSRSFNSA
eukprot:g59629.t1